MKLVIKIAMVKNITSVKKNHENLICSIKLINVLSMCLSSS